MAIKKKPSPTEEALQGVSPSLDDSCRFPLDKLLRDNKYRIWCRKPNQEPVWMDRRGHFLKQSEALSRLPQGRVEDAHYVGEIYFDMKFHD